MGPKILALCDCYRAINHIDWSIMAIESTGDGGFVVTGQDVRFFADLSTLHAYGISARGMTNGSNMKWTSSHTVTGFRTHFNIPAAQCRNWTDVARIVADVKARMKAEREKAKGQANG